MDISGYMMKEISASYTGEKFFNQAFANAYENNRLEANYLSRAGDYDRSKYVDSGKMDKYKNEKFDGNDVMKDELEGKDVYRKKADAEKCSGEVAHVDHIVPLKTISDMAEFFGNLTDEQIKEIANDDSNFLIVTAHFNESKQNKSNFEMAKKAVSAGELKKAALLTGYGMAATTIVAGKMSKASIENKVDDVKNNISNAGNAVLT